MQKQINVFTGGIQMKKLINGVDNVVDEMLNGMTAAFPQYIERVPGTDVVAHTGAKKTDKVVLISGGGSGHEPAHGGYVGKGMLDAAVAGAVFTSPTPDQVYEAIQATECGKGALLIIKNYTGDVMNFEMAADMAADEDIVVDKVVVADDVAVENSTWTTGRRGIAGTVFVHKIAGACAETGADLPEVKRIAEKVIANVRSMGMAVSPCTVPAVGKPGFDLADDEVEIGIGIHGEPGTHREKISSVNNTVDHLVGKILDEGIYAEGDEVAVMVNGMGATPLSELFIANLRVKEILDEKKISIAKTLVGNYMTSLDMAGFSVTLLKLDDELKGFLNAPADTPAYKEV
jgi:dihydroxyacetone kinase-like protein